MPVVLDCGACRGKMQLPDGFRAEAVKCPTCGQAVRVPAAAQAPPAGVVLTCPGCKMMMRLPAAAPGQAVKCPGCAVVFTVAGAPAPAAAPPPAAPPPAASRPAAPPAPPPLPPTAPLPPAARPAAPPSAPAHAANGNAAPPSPPAAAPITVKCSGCKASIRVPAKKAGSSVKCPGCGTTVNIPVAGTAPPPAAPAAKKAGPPVWGPEWIEVNEAADPAQASSWGEHLLEGHDLPDKFRTDIQAALTKGERLVWCDRPQLQMMIDAAKKFQLIVGSLLTLGLVIGLAVAIYFFIEEIWVGVIVPLVFCFFFAIVDIYALLAPRLTRKNAPRRACYLMTNRRLLIHGGSGTQFQFGLGGATVAQVRAGVTPVTGPEMLTLYREETPKYPGAGHLYLGAGDKGETGASGRLDYLANVRDVERMIREKLIHPFVDKLLAPRPPDAEEKAFFSRDPNIKAAPGGGEAAAAADDPNVKAAPGGGKDPNVKDFDSDARPPKDDLRHAPQDARQEAEAELTAGERLLWVGAPDPEVKGRGLEGIDVEGNKAKRLEPAYRFYALTNRRALLFADGAPVSYYPPRLLKCQTEDDPRVPDGGSVIFNVIVTTITTQDKKTGREISKRCEVTFMGLLRIRSYRNVAGLLKRTLVTPLQEKL